MISLDRYGMPQSSCTGAVTFKARAPAKYQWQVARHFSRHTESDISIGNVPTQGVKRRRVAIDEGAHVTFGPNQKK